MRCSVRPSALARLFSSTGCGMTPSIVTTMIVASTAHLLPLVGTESWTQGCFINLLSIWSYHMQRDQRVLSLLGLGGSCL